MKLHRPVYILTGFLGAGKTTLLNRILTENHGHKFAVIINEFGQMGLDAHLLNTSQDFVQMDNGCLCCVLNEDLVRTIKNLKDRLDYSAIVLETTGIADPLPIAWTFFREDFVNAFRFGGIITVVDVLHFETAQKWADEVRCQIERADYIYLSKTQKATSEQIHSVKKAVLSLQPHARLILDDDPDFYKLVFDIDDTLTLLPPSHHKHENHFESLSFDLNQKKITLNQMEDFFEGLPQSVYRAKAIFRDEVTQQVYVIHAVCGRVEFYESPSESVMGCVLIGKNLEFDTLYKLASVLN